MLARIVFFIHIAAIVILLLGWLAPLNFLAFHLLLIALTILQWRCNQDQCVLTQIQYRLEKKKLKKDEQGQFIRSLCLVFGSKPNDRQLCYIIYSLLGTSFLLSLGRLLLST